METPIKFRIECVATQVEKHKARVHNFHVQKMKLEDARELVLEASRLANTSDPTVGGCGLPTAPGILALIDAETRKIELAIDYQEGLLRNAEERLAALKVEQESE